MPSRWRSHEPFNRCKLFIRARKPELAAEIEEREAMVRMMSGFYRGLLWGAREAIGVLGISALLGGVSLWAASSPFGHRPAAFGCLMLISIASFVFNWFFLGIIRKNFHSLRMGESDVVFDAYLITRSPEIDTGK
jgi:hypothetical protein